MPMPKLIDAIPYLGKDKVEELEGFLRDRFQKSVEARSTQLDQKYTNWMNNYSAKPNEEVRTTPWYGASNFIPQLIRMHTDILTARMCGIIFGTKPFWKIEDYFGTLPHQIPAALSTWMEFECFKRMDYFDPLHSGIYRAFKTGTNVYKAFWMDPAIYSFNVATGLGEGNNMSSTTVVKEGLALDPIPFEDFYPYPLNVGSLAKVQAKFHRLRFSKEDVEWRGAQGFWDKAAVEHMIQTNGDYKPVTAREGQAAQAGITLTKDTVLPFTAVEVWFDYPFPDGKKYKLVAVFNPFTEKGQPTLLRFYFNYDRSGDDPFIDQRPMPREDFFYGYAIPEILEGAQEEQAQIHNARRDANTIANVPTFKKKSRADVPNPNSDWYPGRVWDVDQMDDVDVMAFGGNYNSMIEEEGFVLGLADKYTGISAPMQAMGSGIMDGKRGVYSAQGTMAMLQAGSDRPDLYLRQFRSPFHKIGRFIYNGNRYYRTNPIPFELWGNYGAFLKQAFELQESGDFDPIHFSLSASDGSSNREVDRSNLLLMANTLAGYYNQIFQAASVVTQLPEGQPLREILLTILDGAKDLANRLLFMFDVGDRARLVPDIREVLGGGVEQGPPQAGAPDQAGLSQAEAPVSVTGIQSLVANLDQLPGRST